MKNLSKIGLLALVVAASFTACTKDSKAPAPTGTATKATVTAQNKATAGVTLVKRDTITPVQVILKRDTITPIKIIITPLIKRDTITPVH